MDNNDIIMENKEVEVVENKEVEVEVTETDLAIAKSASLIQGTADDLEKLVNTVNNCVGSIKQSYLQLCLALKEINDKQLYLLENSSMNEFCEAKFGWTRMNVSRYLRAAEKPKYLEAGFAPAEICSIKDNFTEEQEQFILDHRKDVKGKDVKNLVDYVQQEQENLSMDKFMNNMKKKEENIKFPMREKYEKKEKKEEMNSLEKLKTALRLIKSLENDTEWRRLEVNDDNITDYKSAVTLIMDSLNHVFNKTWIQDVLDWGYVFSTEDGDFNDVEAIVEYKNRGGEG